MKIYEFKKNALDNAIIQFTEFTGRFTNRSENLLFKL